jgi:phosphoenolpyruvate-protein kinase (PTS system EI component)
MLTDSDSLTQLESIASGRTHKDMVYLCHLAHEKVARDAERTKHVAMKAALHSTAALAVSPAQAATDWATRKAYLLDGQGSHILDISLGLAVGALLDDNQAEFEFQMHAVFKSAVKALPHVLQQAMAQRMAPPTLPLSGGSQ